MKEKYIIPLLTVKATHNHTVQGQKIVDVIKHVQNAILESDAGLACDLSCELFVSGALQKLVGLFLDLFIRIGSEVAISHNLHKNIAALKGCSPTDFNRIETRHLLIDTVVKMSILFKRQVANSEINACFAVSLQALKNEFTGMLESASNELSEDLIYRYQVQTGLNAKIVNLIVQMTNKENRENNENRILRLIIFLLKQSKDKDEMKDKIENLIWFIALKGQHAQRAKVLLELYQFKPKPVLLVCCFAKIKSGDFTVGENKNLLLALLKTNLLFEDIRNLIIKENSTIAPLEIPQGKAQYIQRSIDDMFNERRKMNAIRHITINHTNANIMQI